MQKIIKNGPGSKFYLFSYSLNYERFSFYEHKREGGCRKCIGNPPLPKKWPNFTLPSRFLATEWSDWAKTWTVRWYRRLSLFFEIAHNQAPQYLCNIITPQLPLWRRNPNNNANDKRFKLFFSRTLKFGDSFFPSCIADWNNLDEKF